ncbi:hypothetical protein BN873_p20058 [Candidatus Competibacter denitrificans Run_A_D11]|uniref:Uncharacterized protein n=1 Tax=Candidatus Competibacter denitrificans Run_A_D11 TaxID=1400863 RepID=W6MEI6_9GAMM|nr:hypothetical protein BN873_p20058 [Candidatus Competibacter denitrificans Run_A_D11]
MCLTTSYATDGSNLSESILFNRTHKSIISKHLSGAKNLQYFINPRNFWFALRMGCHNKCILVSSSNCLSMCLDLGKSVY